ncbi:hypothetical protein Tamer19_33430 [Cupriavidus sp. TA19]|uniref:hypothetical protein n=1 Tax=unclassified Cupriavidus TaxID=2640874 RepID=UPI000E2E6189|nr:MULTISPECIES: hypothetical protein [unclassified Cupriavidus]BDB24185.1 hypothetical protein CTP10_R15330 [Cupriavidus sp. P-10]GLC93935.1 hypothetical protein Tamer19_33430 [Cupriavidus sp. TA19]
MEATFFPAILVAAAVACFVWQLRNRFLLYCKSYLLLNGLVMAPVNGREISLVGHHDGRDISGVVPAESILYKIESPLKKKLVYAEIAQGDAPTVLAWELPKYSVQVFCRGETIWSGAVSRREALRIREAVEACRKRARAPRSGDKTVHDLQFLRVD